MLILLISLLRICFYLLLILKGVIKLRVGIHILHCFSQALVSKDLDVNENESYPTLYLDTN